MADMTPRQRMLAAIEGNEVDTIPVAPRIWRYCVWKKLSDLEFARRFGCELIVYPRAVINAVSDCPAERLGEILPDVKVDLVQRREGAATRVERTFHTPAGILHDVYVQPDPGGEYGVAPNCHWIEHLVKTRQDVERIPYLLPPTELVEKNLASTRDFERQMGEAGIVAYRPTVAPDAILVDAMGLENALVASIEDPELFARLLGIAVKWHQEVMRRILEGGFKIIYDVWYNFSLSAGWSPSFYRQWVMPILKANADIIHSYGAKMFHYDDGKLRNSIDCIVGAGADMLETLTPPPSGDLDYQDVAAKYGGKICLIGGVDTVRLRFDSPAQIEQAVRDAIDIFGPTRKFILGLSDSIPDLTPEENVRAFIASARTYGKAMAGKLCR